MKVWITKMKGNYSGGMLLVAADSAEEAHAICLDCDDLEYIYWEWECENISDLKYKVQAYQGYAWEDWEEIPDLEYHGATPCIIAEAGYAE